MTEQTVTENSGRSPVGWALRALVAAAALAFVGLLAYGVAAQSPNTSIDDALAQGHAPRAPAFRLAVLRRGSLGPILGPRLARVLDRPEVSLAELRGTPIVLNMWASWCVPCQQEAPTLERAWQTQARPRGVLFLGLDQQDATSDAQNFMRHYHIDYTNIHDQDNDVPRAYGATGVPETFFITAQGRIVGHIPGESDSQQLAEGIRAALTGRVVRSFLGGAQGAFR